MPDLKNLKKERRSYYDSIVYVECPILGVNVWFTSSGFNHLINKSDGVASTNPRNPREQYMKLMHLKYAEYVIRNCTEVTRTQIVRKKQKGKWKKGTQYELVCEVSKNKKIRVVVERIGDGKYKFLSVMPHDNRSKHKSSSN